MRWNPVWGYYNQREKKEWEIDFIVVVEISNGVGGGAPLRTIDISTQTTAPNPVDDDGPPHLLRGRIRSSRDILLQ